MNEERPSSHERVAEAEISPASTPPDSERSEPPPSSGAPLRPVVTEPMGSTASSRTITQRMPTANTRDETPTPSGGTKKPPSSIRVDTPTRAIAESVAKRFSRYKKPVPSAVAPNEFSVADMRRQMRAQAGLPAQGEDDRIAPVEDVRSTSGELAARAGVGPRPLPPASPVPRDHEPSVKLTNSVVRELKAPSPVPESPSDSEKRKLKTIIVPRSAPTGAESPASNQTPSALRWRVTKYQAVMGAAAIVSAVALGLLGVIASKYSGRKQEAERPVPAMPTAPVIEVTPSHVVTLPTANEEAEAPPQAVPVAHGVAASSGRKEPAEHVASPAFVREQPSPASEANASVRPPPLAATTAIAGEDKPPAHEKKPKPAERGTQPAPSANQSSLTEGSL